MFKEENTVEQFLIDTLIKHAVPSIPDGLFGLYANGIKDWRFVAPKDIPRAFDQVLV